MSAAATILSSVCLTANCQPLGRTDRSLNSGIPPMCSSPTLTLMLSNRRGTSETSRPSSSQRRTIGTNAASDPREDRKASTTCSAPVLVTISSSSSGLLRTGAWRPGIWSSPGG